MSTWPVEPRVLQELGFAEVARAWADYTLTPRGRAGALEPVFYSRRSSVETSLLRMEEARKLAREELAVPLGGTEEVGEHLERARKSAVLSGPEVMQCGRVLRVACETRAFLMAHGAQAPRLLSLGGQLANHGALASSIEGAFETDGSLRDDASYALQEHRGNVRRLHRRMRSQIENYLKDDDFAENLQDDFFSIRGQRYVLPIKASHRGRVPGIIHNASNSGETVFVEPQPLVGLGNELTIAQSLVEEEERRILAEFSRDVGDVATDVESAMNLLAQIDLACASAALANRLDASIPKLVTESRWDLRSLRHPLLVLQGKEVVSNNVVLNPAERVLVVSGPNAGGKTVTITAVGLSSLMLRAGLAVPVGEGSSMPLPDQLMTLIGDHQSLAEDLSTFSSHLKCLAEMTQVAAPGALLLVDEIASGTDPAEGAALAQAVLERLVEKGAMVMLTTHLEAVKALGLTQEAYVNARVAFDSGSMLPTYHLELDVAGMSNALEVAALVGMEPSVVTRARSCLEGSSALTVALQRLMEKEREVETIKLEADRHREELEQEVRAAKIANRALEEAKLGAEELVRTEMLADINRVNDDLKAMMASLQNKSTIQATQSAQRKVKAHQQELEKEREKLRAQQKAKSEPSPRQAVELRVGAKVHVPKFNKDAEIVAIDGDRIQVAVGPMKMRVSRNEILGTSGSGKKLATQAPNKREKDAQVFEGESGGRLDLRGMRAGDVEMALNAFLDQAYYKGPPRVTVVHGHGSGAVRKVVQEMLQASPYVKEFRYGERGEGGDGATIVTLDA